MTYQPGHLSEDLSLSHADSNDFDQTGWMPRLISLYQMQMPYCWFSCSVAQMVYVDFTGQSLGGSFSIV